MELKKDIQRERLFFLEVLVFFTGQVSRKDLVSRFGISEPAATKDLSLYAKLAPDVLLYDIRKKTYVLSKGIPLFSHDIDQTLYSLAGERAIAVNSGHAKRLSGWTNSSIKHMPALDLVTKITRCMFLGLDMNAEYYSLSSGKKYRKLSPLALVNDGLRWHIRCFDYDKKRFGDYNLGRFSEVKEATASSSTLKDDSSWNSEVILKLIPHPKAKHPETISIDYDIIEGVKNIKLKSCLIGYFLRHWNIDYSDTASGNPDAQQLFLTNREELILAGVSKWAFSH